jgi:hypothetical protein
MRHRYETAGHRPPELLVGTGFEAISQPTYSRPRAYSSLCLSPCPSSVVSFYPPVDAGAVSGACGGGTSAEVALVSAGVAVLVRRLNPFRHSSSSYSISDRWNVFASVGIILDSYLQHSLIFSGLSVDVRQRPSLTGASHERCPLGVSPWRIIR